MENWLVVEKLGKNFPIRKTLFSRRNEAVRAVSGISFSLAGGETLGLVGESGCGKTTLGRMIVRLIEPDQGRILYKGTDLIPIKGRGLKPFRRKIQMIFQDPYSSLNPRMSVGEIIAEPLLIHREVRRREKRKKVGELLESVGLSADHYDRYPHEFSGGQRQRIGIARAIALKPDILVADEPVSALDVSVASQVLDLLKEFQKKFGMSYLFIAHDLRMVRFMSHRIAVMYLGKFVELASQSQFQKPLHPYTQALVEAVPVADPKTQRKRIVLSGEVPSPLNPPSGCSFHPRCPYAEARCQKEEPVLREWRPGHWAACHFVEEIQGGQS